MNQTVIDCATIGILGDAQAFPRRFITPQLLKILISYRPDMVVQLGDHGMRQGSLPEWESFRKLLAPLDKAGIPWIPIIGNHEVDYSWHADLHARLFRLPGNGCWFSRHINGGDKSDSSCSLKTKIIVCDTDWVPPTGFLDPDMLRARGKTFRQLYHQNKGRIKGIQYQWLEKELKKSNDMPVLMFFHRPLFPPPWHSHAGACLDQYPAMRRRLLNLFRRHNVLATFSGHEHAFHMVGKAGILHMVSGAGGVMLRYYKGHRDIFHHALIARLSMMSDGDEKRCKSERYMVLHVTALDLWGNIRRTAIVIQPEISRSWRFLAGFDGHLNAEAIRKNRGRVHIYGSLKTYRDIIGRKNRFSTSLVHNPGFNGTQCPDVLLHIATEKPGAADQIICSGPKYRDGGSVIHTTIHSQKDISVPD